MYMVKVWYAIVESTCFEFKIEVNCVSLYCGDNVRNIESEKY